MSDISEENDPRPEPPREPEQWECCTSGCTPCIYDIYWEKLALFEQALLEWEQRRQPPDVPAG